MLELHKIRARAALMPRKEPYWMPAPLGGRGRVLGYRKIDDGSGSWIARMRDQDNRKLYKALGPDAPDFGFDEARVAALAWFEGRDVGVEDDATVGSAFLEYIADRAKNRGESSAKYIRFRYGVAVQGKPFANIKLNKLRKQHIEDWRAALADKQGVPLASSTRNVYLKTLKGALNLAVANRRVAAAAALEWGSVKTVDQGDNRRKLFLDAGQRRALLAAIPDGGFRDLVQGALLTGARPGELDKARVSQFDKRSGTMTFTGKIGTRTVQLSSAAVALFTRLSRSKLPTAYLFTRDDGSHWPNSSYDHLMREAALKAELPPGVCLYTCRHSFISECLAAGLATLEVAKTCGTSIVQIENHYGHLVTNMRERLDKVAML